MTETANLENLNKAKIENLKLERSNLSEIFENIDKNNKNFENVSKIDEVSKNAKILNIELISSYFEPKGLILRITPYGYEKSLRKENDGITYFGYEENQEDNVSQFFFNFFS